MKTRNPIGFLQRGPILIKKHSQAVLVLPNILSNPLISKSDSYDCWTNSPCQHLRKCIGTSMENMHTDVLMKGITIHR